MSDLIRLDKIAKRSGEIMCVTLQNTKNASTGKNGWGSLTLAVPNEWIQKMLTEKAIGVLYCTTQEEWEKEKTNE